MPNNERIDRALRHLRDGLRPKCEDTWQGFFGDDWLDQVNQKLHNPEREPTTEDAAFLFKALKATWNDIFRHAFSPQDRNYVFELADARNKWAHQGTFSSDDSLRVLDSAERLLESFGDQDNRLLIQELRRGLMRQVIEGEARSERRRTAKAPTEGEPQAGLASWRDIVAPHDDVASGRLTQAEFAADLSLVATGKAGTEYQDPKAFFARTYLTTRLTGLLTEAALRLSGRGGEPAIELQTNFGGGKTHALIALYHLAGGTPVSELAGVAELLERDGEELTLPADIKRAVIVGPDISPTRPKAVADDIQLHTLWGHLAWQLGGHEGYEMLRAADEGVDGQRGDIDKPSLIKLFEFAGPSIILIDEWVAYARQLRDDNPGAGGSFGSQFTFAQALLEAAAAVDNVMVLVTLPQSEVEVGGEQGVRALAELKEVTSRNAKKWLDQQTDESFEIVRRRLFEPITAENARIRDGVIRAFQEMYRNDQKSFPAGCHDDNFRQRMEMSYPIHPELFDRLFEDWSTIEGFQRTRGALRLMSLVISELWNRGDTSLMIMPGTLPLDSGAVAAELRKHLEDGWDAVIQSNVDGPGALPTSLDQNNKHFGRLSATRRVARSVYMGSAPRTDGSNGVNINSVMLGSTQPGEPVRQVEDALRRLANEATHLHNSGSQYWYSLTPTLGREAANRAESEFNDLDADAELRRRLSEEARNRGSFAGGVQVFAEGPGDVPDDDDGARLVILNPSAAHGSGTTTAATELAEKIINQRDGGPRVNRNLLVFVAATQARVDELRMTARRHLAWKSIERDKQLDLKESQREQSRQRRRQARRGRPRQRRSAEEKGQSRTSQRRREKARSREERWRGSQGRCQGQATSQRSTSLCERQAARR